MQTFWRIKDLLEWTTRYFGEKGLAEPRLEAEVLLAHVLRKPRVYLYANYEEPVNPSEREVYRDFIKRRVRGEPAAYITGSREFMSLPFHVSPAVLIPRPDTEVLVETAIDLARQENVYTIIDVGTGSGAIPVSLAVYLQEINDLQVYATDISSEALEIARENAAQHQVDIHFAQGDLLQAFITQRKENEWAPGIVPVDMITANLPYIPISEMANIDQQVKDFEPHQALFAEGDGLELYRRLIPQASVLLRPDGILLLEIDARQAAVITDIMNGFTDLRIIKDWAGRDRVVQARRKKDV